ncbi:ATP-binding cassette domain-containing protein [Patescibacteria group bacterium]
MLSVQGLTKSFNGLIAVDNVSFEAKAGEIFGLLGPNGAGKTTTIRVIATVLEATGGTAEVAGFDIKKQPEDVRRNIGVLTAEIGLYDRFTARENLRYFGRLYGIQGQKLEDRIEELFNVLDMRSFADRRAGKFSTGMKQKVAIARSIIHDPKVIIFDEPTAGLDVLASRTIIEFMKKAREMGKLVILSTHDMFDAEKLSDRVGILHRGKLVAVNTVKGILESTGASNLEEAFMQTVREKQLSTESDEERKKKSQSLTTRSKKSNLTKVRISSFVFVAIGLAVQFSGFLGDASDMVGVSLVIIGALGAVISKQMLKKYQK